MRSKEHADEPEPCGAAPASCVEAAAFPFWCPCEVSVQRVKPVSYPISFESQEDKSELDPRGQGKDGLYRPRFLALLSCDDFFNDSAEVEALNAELGAQAAQISW